MEFVELTEGEVKGLKFACGNFLQSWQMYQRYQQLGRESYFVGVKQDGKILAAGLMMVRNWHLGKKIFRVPGGWLMDYEGDYREVLEFLTKEAREFCRKKAGIVLEISPNVVAQPRDTDNNVVEGRNHLQVRADLEKLGYKYLGEYGQAKWIYVLDLPGKTPEGLLMEFRTTHRQLIRKAERDGVRVRGLGLDELDILKQITAESGERHGFQEPEVGYYQSMAEAFGGEVRFLVAEIPVEKVRAEDLEGTEVINGYVPLAASMFVDDGREIVYLYSGSIRKLQRYNGVYAIQWKMITEALAEGRERYNFYGTKPVAENGVYKFKQGFRGYMEELLGTFALPIGLIGKIYAARLKPHEYGEVQ